MRAAIVQWIAPVAMQGAERQVPMAEPGDCGQRYEIRASGWPDDGDCVVGWTDDLERAEKIANSIEKEPDCLRTEIFDRQEGVSVISRFRGILR